MSPSLSNGGIYAILTNMAAKGSKGALVAMILGTDADQIVEILELIPERQRKHIEEIHWDMVASVKNAVRSVFTNARLVIDRFHLQQLAFDAVQELQIRYRWDALESESKVIEVAKAGGETYWQVVSCNGDTEKHLPARSGYLLFKLQSSRTESQHICGAILFGCPELRHAYDPSRGFCDIFNKSKTKEAAFRRLALWYNMPAILAFPLVKRVSLMP